MGKLPNANPFPDAISLINIKIQINNIHGSHESMCLIVKTLYYIGNCGLLSKALFELYSFRVDSENQTNLRASGC